MASASSAASGFEFAVGVLLSWGAEPAASGAEEPAASGAEEPAGSGAGALADSEEEAEEEALADWGALAEEPASGGAFDHSDPPEEDALAEEPAGGGAHASSGNQPAASGALWQEDTGHQLVASGAAPKKRRRGVQSYWSWRKHRERQGRTKVSREHYEAWKAWARGKDVAENDAGDSRPPQERALAATGTASSSAAGVGQSAASGLPSAARDSERPALRPRGSVSRALRPPPSASPPPPGCLPSATQGSSDSDSAPARRRGDIGEWEAQFARRGRKRR